MRRSAALGLLGALLVALAAAPAHAGPPGSWSRLMGPAQSSTAQIGLARTPGPDGLLHVAWHSSRGPAGNDLVHQWILNDGRPSAYSRIATGWAEAGDIALVRNGAGLSAWFTGRRTLDTAEPDGLFVSTSPFGTTWSAPTLVYSDATVHGRTPSATFAGGRFFQAWYDVVDTVVHADGALWRYPLGEPRCCSYQQSLASAGSSALVAWCSGGDAPNGIWVQPVGASGAPGGAPMLMPGSAAPFEGRSVRACEAAGRVPLVARAGGGFYVAEGAGYPATTRVHLWRVGTGRVLALAGGSGEKRTVALAAAPDGRLWAAWSVRGTNRLFLRRSNRAATNFGRVVSIPFPAGQIEATELDLSAQGDRVDLVARFVHLSGVSLFHTQAHPGLTLEARGGRVARFRVTDAGDPVAGAVVTVGGRAVRTNASGEASVDLPAGVYTAVASKPRYVSASARVRTV